MDERFIRTQMLIGEEGVKKLQDSHIALFGLGGVGGIAGEALIRSGVGKLTVVDCDEVSPSNLNRQIIATTSSIGKPKTQVISKRLKEINPTATVNEYNLFFLPETADQIDFTQFDFIIDAVDTVTAKIEIIMRAKAAGVPIVSVMGTGNKLDPTKVRLGELFETSYCPLCKIMRRELKKRGLTSLTAVYSDEQPLSPTSPQFTEQGKAIPGSMTFVPSTAGLTAAYCAIQTLLSNK